MADRIDKAPVWVFYDGLCHLCTGEIRHYRKHPNSNKLKFVDISLPDFDASAFGLDRQAVHAAMHVRKSDGAVAVGVDAFVAIWEALGGYGPLRWIATRRWLRPALDLGYTAFARVRPYLPKRGKSDGACELPPHE
jgi:predicted DCC family thiol-disulfide oxidoreductase YuxK